MSITSYAIFIFILSFIGIVSMITWRIVEIRQQDKRSSLRKMLDRIDDRLSVALSYSRHHTGTASKSILFLTFVHLPDALIQISWDSYKVFGEQYERVAFSWKKNKKSD